MCARISFWAVTLMMPSLLTFGPLLADVEWSLNVGETEGTVDMNAIAFAGRTLAPIEPRGGL